MTDPEFSAVLALIELLADPAAAKAKLQELQSAREALEVQETKTNLAAASLQTERSKLESLAKTVRQREIAVHQEESRLAAAREEIDRWKSERSSRLVEVAPGLFREPDDTPRRADPITDRYAEPMGTPEREAPRHRGSAQA
jgi:chromosome segregation ATPase